MSGVEVRHWWDHYGTRLFAKNLRSLLGDTEVNDEIRRTIASEAEHFWYFNNGITIVTDSVAKTMAGGGDRDFGTFQCKNISIVNGAQTVSTIGRHAAAVRFLDQLRVPLRIISLEGCPETFGGNVTRANNRQNRIENRDFVSQDPVQAIIQRDLAIDGIEYVLMRSESFVPSEKSFDLIESTTALACASGTSSLVVQLKREISKLWENLDKAPYKELFNPNIPGIYVWRCVLIQRIIDRALGDLIKAIGGASDRSYGVAVHGNRMVSLLAFAKISRGVLSKLNAVFDLADIEPAVRSNTNKAHTALVDSLKELFPPNAILPTLFKNATKCKQLHETASRKMLPAAAQN